MGSVISIIQVYVNRVYPAIDALVFFGVIHFDYIIRRLFLVQLTVNVTPIPIVD